MLNNEKADRQKGLKNKLNSMQLKFKHQNFQESQQSQNGNPRGRRSGAKIVEIDYKGDRHNHRSTLSQQKLIVNRQYHKYITITLTLQHPSKSIPIQYWRFENALNLWMGRASNNHIVVRSCVVSRHHVELRQLDGKWILTSFGSNGTYVNGKKISQVCLEDGAIVQLGRTGPAIQIHLTSASTSEDPLEAQLPSVA